MGIAIGLVLYSINYFMDLRIRPLSVVLVTGLAVLITGFMRYNQEQEGQKVSNDRQLVVGTSADFAPFSYIDNGVITGFDIELIMEIVRRLDRKLIVQNMPFGTLISSLQLGTIQVIAAGLTATPERAQHVLFTEPYLENDPLVIVSRKDNPVKSIDALKNKTVTVNQGYTADTYVSSISDITVLRLPTPPDAFLALTSKRADALVAARKTLQVFFDQYSQDNFILFELPNAQENCALAITPRDPQLRDEIQYILHAMKKDGSLDQLRKKWNV